MPRKTDTSVPEAFQQIQRSNPVQDDFGWEIPIETIPLPSRGKIYPQSSALFNRETVQIKAMTAQEEDIMLSRALIKDGTVLTYLINSCLTDKSILSRDMLVGDRTALMVAIRITGYGPDYQVDINCPSCSTKQNTTFDLSSLPLKMLEIDPVAPGMNQFEFVLPVSKKRVTFKFLTGKDEEEISMIAERRRKAMPDMLVDNAITSRLEASIVTIDGVTDRHKINTFIKAMPAQDSRALRTFMNDNEPGIEMNGTLRCIKCSAENRVLLPLGVSFFWP